MVPTADAVMTLGMEEGGRATGECYLKATGFSGR